MTGTAGDPGGIAIFAMASLPDEIDRYCARFSLRAKDVDLCAIALPQLIGQRKRIVVIDKTHRLPAFSASSAPNG